MSFLASIGQGLGSIFGGIKGANQLPFIGPSVGRAGSEIEQAIFGGPDYGQMGKDQKSFMDNAYPGTTPWEHVGAGGAQSTMAQTEAGNQKKQVTNQLLGAQERMKDKELRTQENVANIHASAQKEAAGIQPEATAGLQRAQTINQGKKNEWADVFYEWEAQAKHYEARVNWSKMNVNRAEFKKKNQEYLTEIQKTINEGNQAKISEIVAEYKEWMIWAGLGKDAMQAFQSLMLGVGAGVLMKRGFGGPGSGLKFGRSPKTPTPPHAPSIGLGSRKPSGTFFGSPLKKKKTKMPKWGYEEKMKHRGKEIIKGKKFRTNKPRGKDLN